MPVTKSALKKWRKDKKRTIDNDTFRATVKAAVRVAKKKNTAESVRTAFSLIDKATKKHLMHANKAARMKSALTRTAGDMPAIKPAAKPTKPKKVAVTKPRTPKTKVVTA